MERAGSDRLRLQALTCAGLLIAVSASACADSRQNRIGAASGHAGRTADPPQEAEAGTTAREAGSPVQPMPDAAIAQPDAGAAVMDAAGPAAPQDAAAEAAVDARTPEPQSPTAVYSTQLWGGGLNHVVITKLDSALGYCVRVSIAGPASQPSGEVRVPSSWMLEFIEAIDTNGSCESTDPSGMPRPSARSLSARGQIAWGALGPQGQPCGLSIDIEATFAPIGRIPARDHLLASNLPLTCN